MEKSAVTQPSNQELLMFANQAEPEGLLTHRRAAGFHEKSHNSINVSIFLKWTAAINNDK